MGFDPERPAEGREIDRIVNVSVATLKRIMEMVKQAEGDILYMKNPEAARLQMARAYHSLKDIIDNLDGV